MAAGISEAERKAAVVALAVIASKAGSDTMLTLAEKGSGRAKAEALWWLLNNKNHRWKEHGIIRSLTSRNIYDRRQVKLVPAVLPAPVERTYKPIKEILALKGDAARGKTVAARCYMCHHIDGTGIEYGPNLTAVSYTHLTQPTKA